MTLGVKCFNCNRSLTLSLWCNDTQAEPYRVYALHLQFIDLEPVVNILDEHFSSPSFPSSYTIYYDEQTYQLVLPLFRFIRSEELDSRYQDISHNDWCTHINSLSWLITRTVETNACDVFWVRYETWSCMHARLCFVWLMAMLANVLPLILNICHFRFPSNSFD